MPIYSGPVTSIRSTKISNENNNTGKRQLQAQTKIKENNGWVQCGYIQS